MKKILSFLFVAFLSINFSYALETNLNSSWTEIKSWTELEVSDSENSYIYFYGQGCPHCANVDAYFKWVWAYDTIDIVKKEVYFDDVNREEMNKYATSLWYEESSVWVPFLVIENESWNSSLVWDSPIIDYFTPILWEVEINTRNRAIAIAVLWVLAVLIPVFLIKITNKH